MLPIASGITVSTLTTVKTAELVSGQYQYVGKGVITLVARGSAIGMNAILSVGGVTICDDLPIMAFGATGGLSIKDHVMVSQAVSGGRVSFQLRNTSAGTLTTDYILYFEPSK